MFYSPGDSLTVSAALVALCWFQSDGNSGLTTCTAQLVSRKAPTVCS